MAKTSTLSLIRNTFFLLAALVCFGTPLSHSDEFKNEYYEPLWPGGNAAFEKIYSATACRALLNGASEVIPLPPLLVKPWKDVVVEGDMVWGATSTIKPERYWWYAKVINGVTQWVRMFGEGDSFIYEPQKVKEYYFVGDRSMAIKQCLTPAVYKSVEITAITEGHISNAVEWIEWNHYISQKASNGSVVGFAPLVRWPLHTLFRVKYVPFRP